MQLRPAHRNLVTYAIATVAVGVAYSINDSVFNNFLNLRFSLSGFERSVLEFPRELPGLLAAGVSAIFAFLCSRRLAALSMIFSAIGVATMALFTTSYPVLLLWLFIYSLGVHVYLPLQSAISMELANEGEEGRRLGQIQGLRNFAAVGGSLLVLLLFRFFHGTFPMAFLIAAAIFVAAAGVMFTMPKSEKRPAKLFLKLHKEYRLFYALSVLYGCRKQIFLTFAPWVIVTVYGKPTETIAALLTAGGAAGILFQPLLGRAIDRLGERFVLMGEAVSLVFVCAGYGLARFLFADNVAFVIAVACYIADSMLMSVSMARATYMKKIAVDPAHVTPSLTMAVSMDHVFSIVVALLGGVVWSLLGYQAVFLLGACIAVANFFVARRARKFPKAQSAAASAV